MGRGLRDRIENCADDTFRAVVEFAVPEPQNRPALGFKICGTLRVRRNVGCVLSAIEFDSKPRRAAGEIDNVMTNDALAREAWPLIAE